MGTLRQPEKGKEVLVYASPELRYINFFYILPAGHLLHFGTTGRHKRVKCLHFLQYQRFSRHIVPCQSQDAIQERWMTLYEYIGNKYRDNVVYTYFGVDEKIWTSEFYEKLKNQT